MKPIKANNRRALFFAAGILATLLLTLSLIYFRNEIREILLPQHTPSAAPLREMPREMPQAEKEELEQLLPNASENLDASEHLDQTLQKAQKEVQQRSPEENQRELQRRGKQLKRYVSEETLDQVAEKVQNLPGVERRAEEPSFMPPEGEFDTDTAQIHDVQREQQDDGTYRYFVTLFDAAGRQQKVEMPADEAEPLWQTFQKIKKNPLMEKVYRTMVIPLLDRAAHSKKTE